MLKSAVADAKRKFFGYTTIALPREVGGKHLIGNVGATLLDADRLPV